MICYPTSTMLTTPWFFTSIPRYLSWSYFKINAYRVGIWWSTCIIMWRGVTTSTCISWTSVSRGKNVAVWIEIIYQITAVFAIVMTKAACLKNFSWLDLQVFASPLSWSNHALNLNNCLPLLSSAELSKTLKLYLTFNKKHLKCNSTWATDSL